MKVGQKAVCKPQTFTSGEKTVKGTIVYVHPRMYYVTVEFDVNGGVVRESFFREDISVVKK